MAQLVPLAALGAQKRATEALKGDIYTRSWSEVRGKGKKKRIVEHELHVNPLTIVVAGAVASAGAFALLIGAHLVGKKPSANAVRTARRIVDEYQPVYETEVVPATGHYETRYGHFGESHQVWVEDTPATTRSVLKSALRVVVMSNNFVPRGTYGDLNEALLKMQARYRNARELTHIKEVWATVRGRDVLRTFYEFKYDGYGVQDTGKDEKWGQKFVDIDIM